MANANPVKETETKETTGTETKTVKVPAKGKVKNRIVGGCKIVNRKEFAINKDGSATKIK